MSRRRPKAELQFGSDSFLDVVANLVGILIILIMIAGMRVGRLPSVKFMAMLGESGATPPLSIPNEPVEEPQFTVEIDPSPIDELETPRAPERPPLKPVAVPKELLATTSELEAEIAELAAQETELDGTLARTNEMQALMTEREQTIQSMLDNKAKEIKAKRKQTQAMEADLDLARQTLERLQKELEEIESIPPKVETLQHRITPVSRLVNGHEKHYRLEKERVAEVPIEDLVGRLREQIERRRDWLAKTRQYNGQIGPVRGFNMQYFVKVEPMSDMDSMKPGYGGFKVNLAGWEIHPDPDLQGETAQTALRKGSIFYQSILGTSPDTTLTFWVYPDSYGLYRKLQKFAHEHGFTVAGRPLPDGVPISGSPQGSRSAGQ